MPNRLPFSRVTRIKTIRTRPPKPAVGIANRGRNLAGRVDPPEHSPTKPLEYELPSPLVEEALVPASEKKRGRPRVHVDDAARKQVHRDKQREKEKMEQIAAIIRLVQRYQSRPSREVAPSTASKIFSQN